MTTFSAAYPSYEATAALDKLRAREYARLDVGGHTYLDYTAGNLYATSQVERHIALLREHVAQRVYRMLPLEPAHYAQVQRWLELMDTSLRAADALHLALAAQSGCRLLTADRSLADSARRHDVPYKLLTA